MEIRQLRYLVAVAEVGSFTAAAQREHVAQPAVSAQLAVLEREVGQRLFARTPRGAVPTEAGAELLVHARAVLTRLDDARAALDELTGLVRGRVEVGTVRGAPLGRLAGLLGRFHREHPAVEIVLREGESDELVQSLVSGSLDLAVVGLAGDLPVGLTSRTLLTAAIGGMVRPDHRWAIRRTITLDQLAGEPIVTLARGTGVRDALDAACRDRGIELQVGFEVATVGAAVELAREALGVAVLPAVPDDRSVVGLAPDLHAFSIRKPVVRSRLALAWAATATVDGRPAVRALVAAASAPSIPDRTRT